MIKGTVKFYDPHKGFGFIAGEDGRDYFVGSRDLDRANRLKDGQSVQFEPARNHKGMKANLVSPVSTSRDSDASSKPSVPSDKVQCRHCERNMVPRVLTQKGHATKSICPFCGNTHRNFQLEGMLGLGLLLAVAGGLYLIFS